MTSQPETQSRRGVFLDRGSVIVIRNQMDAHNERGSSRKPTRDDYIITGGCGQNYLMASEGVEP